MKPGVSPVGNSKFTAEGEDDANEESAVSDAAASGVRSSGESRSSVLVFRDRQAFIRRSMGRASNKPTPEAGSSRKRVDARVRPTLGKSPGVAGRRMSQ